MDGVDGLSTTYDVHMEISNRGSQNGDENIVRLMGV